jgi:hypothetical protein
MSIWIQHGYGKGDKPERLADSNRLAGVVLSPADDEPDSLRVFADQLHDWEVQRLLDPQLYVYSIEGGTGRCHDTHGLDFADVRWSASAKAIESHVDAVIAANKAIGIDRVVAPTPLQSGFLDFWAPVALQYARTTTDVAGAETLASLVIEEGALADWDSAEEWLDEASQLDVAGFYLIVARAAGPYPTAWSATKLCNYLRLIHRLIQNEYTVLAGYTDIEAIALAAIGAETATGWFYSQRRFTEGKWKPGSGGRAAIPRVMSDRLLVPVQLQEAERILRSNLSGSLTADGSLRSTVLGGSWGATQARQQFLDSMADLCSEFATGDVLKDRVSAAIVRVDRAHGELSTLAGRGLLPGAPEYIRLVQAIADALKCFRQSELAS